MLLYTLQVTDELSSKAFRLMAVAVGVLPKVAKLDLQHMSQHFEHSWSDQGAV